MKLINRKLLLKFSVFCFLLLVMLFACANVRAQYKYTPMENIPGFEGVADFPSYILSITKFGIWTVGIAALLMITIGGFMYITSAGNTSRMDAAKKVIFDSIYGLIVALAAWLLLFVINPDLVKISTILPPMERPSAEKTPARAPSQSPNSSGIGPCKPLSSGLCSVENLKSACFGSNAEKASAICNAESGGNASLGSGEGKKGGDKCQPGEEIVSWGLFQINLTYHKINGLSCPATTGAFDKFYTGSNHKCNVINTSLYNDCVTAAKNPQFNIDVACKISNNGSSWSQWGANRKCKF